MTAHKEYILCKIVWKRQEQTAPNLNKEKSETPKEVENQIPTVTTLQYSECPILNKTTKKTNYRETGKYSPGIGKK